MTDLRLSKEADLPSVMLYRDRWLILIGIPLINVINYYLTYPDIQADAHTLITFTVDTLEGYLAWYAGRVVVLEFDKRYPWERTGWRRLVLQIPAVAIAVLAVIIGCTEIINAIARDEPVPMDFYTHDIFLFVIWSLVLNGVYLGIYLYQKVTHPQDETTNAVTNLPAEILVNSDPYIITKTGNKQKLIYLRDVKSFCIEHDYVRAVTNQGTQIIPDYTLEKLETLLEPMQFFRANRQCIITRELVAQVTREKDGKLLVNLIPVPGQPETITISRLRATAFKQWLSNSSLV
ncbi:LytTR family transcriptional regulator [Adhaeribacter swui]|uniref:LytTR family transcriptional regulator n=1 Tax=Adhaeribacter swui TaxID=2086471 RepID=A0A7G7GEC1_9BACT|nr:LytTR family DNA-binding domain-containing protein [Adhaeribacter swui]QNF35505.1 LytTR family transcriptional regulator [Adhaeribacter swui]